MLPLFTLLLSVLDITVPLWLPPSRDPRLLDPIACARLTCSCVMDNPKRHLINNSGRRQPSIFRGNASSQKPSGPPAGPAADWLCCYAPLPGLPCGAVRTDILSIRSAQKFSFRSCRGRHGALPALSGGHSLCSVSCRDSMSRPVCYA